MSAWQAMRRAALLSALLCLFLALPLTGPVLSQTQQAILIVDRERVMRDSLPARQLAERERAARLQRRAELDLLRAELEAEEAEISSIRDSGDRAEFEARVKTFDQRVRSARQDSQAAWEALEARFGAARQRMAAALDPVFQEIMAERGASLLLDARTVLAARTGVDITEEAIRRFNAQAATLPIFDNGALPSPTE
ncbi:MAG: OmpH family outer membrane protein [Pseudomonadota bacterium]